MYRKVKLFSALFLVVVMAALLSAPAFASSGGGGHGGGEDKKKEESGGMFGGSDMYYVRMDPIVLPIINERGVREVVSLLIALEVKDQQTIERVNRLTPKLSDAYMRMLYGRIGTVAYRHGEFIDVTKLKTKLTDITESVVGKGVVQDVLIQGVNQRAFN